MMRWGLCVLFVVLFGNLLYSQEPSGKILFPLVPAPQVLPKLDDSKVVQEEVPVDQIFEDQIYVVKSDEDFVLLVSPDNGDVVIAREQGPILVRGVFSDGSGSVETRKIESKYIAFVNAVPGKSAALELLAIPRQIPTDNLIARQRVVVGTGPQPPPKPDPVPDDSVIVPKGLRVLFIFETTENNSREVLNVLASTKIAKFLNDNCVKSSDNFPEWRRWDKDIVVDSKESPTIKELWESVKSKLGSTPKMVVAVDGKATIVEFPLTEDAAISKIKELSGVK